MGETILLYGDSGSGKTSQIVKLAEYIYEKHRKITRVVTWDGGGSKPIEDSGLIEAGVIKLINALNFPYALAVLKRFTRGEWIYKTKDGQKVFAPTPDAAWEKIGAYAFEGLSSTSDRLLDHISEQDEKVVFQNARYVEDGETIGTNNEGHYGLIQKEMHKAVIASKTLPVEYVMWTGHVSKAEDGRTRETAYGPQLAGKKKTLVAPGWFGSCLHIQTFEEPSEDSRYVEISRFAYYINHPDPQTGVKYLAKARCAASVVPELLELLPGGFVALTPEQGIEQYLKALDQLRVAARDKTNEWKRRIDNQIGEQKE